MQVPEASALPVAGVSFRFRGRVQGVGFRPHVARVARRLGLAGWVLNDDDGVLACVAGAPDAIEAFAEAVQSEAPPLARILEVERGRADIEEASFTIRPSGDQGGVRTVEITPDAGSCPKCRAEVLDPLARRYRYPFTTCTDCGPRFSTTTDLPLDRQTTTMAGFEPCAACQHEYEDIDDRRFHAQTIACFACGPKAWLERADGRAFDYTAYTMMDEVDAALTPIQRGEIV
ncbi:MAG: acylphosphatase, partial [Myxococcota bacterium]